MPALWKAARGKGRLRNARGEDKGVKIHYTGKGFMVKGEGGVKAQG